MAPAKRRVISPKVTGNGLEPPASPFFFLTILRILTTRLPPFLSPPTGLLMVARGFSFFFFSICKERKGKTYEISNQSHHKNHDYLTTVFIVLPLFLEQCTCACTVLFWHTWPTGNISRYPGPGQGYGWHDAS